MLAQLYAIAYTMVMENEYKKYATMLKLVDQEKEQFINKKMERELRIAKLYLDEQLSHEKIARIVGLSRQRVQQILKNMANNA